MAGMKLFEVKSYGPEDFGKIKPNSLMKVITSKEEIEGKFVKIEEKSNTLVLAIKKKETPREILYTYKEMSLKDISAAYLVKYDDKGRRKETYIQPMPRLEIRAAPPSGTTKLEGVNQQITEMKPIPPVKGNEQIIIEPSLPPATKVTPKKIDGKATQVLEKEGETLGKEKEESIGTLTMNLNEIDKYIKPRGGAHAFFGKNFYIKTDVKINNGWMTAGEAIEERLEEIDKNWKQGPSGAKGAKHIDIAKEIAPGGKWDKRKTLKSTLLGITSWARTKPLLFAYLYASGQTFEFKLTGDTPLITEEGIIIPVGAVVQGKIKSYNKDTGEFTVEITAILDDFTVNGGEPLWKPPSIGEEKGGEPSEVTPKKEVGKWMGISKAEIKELEGLTTKELLEMITLDYGLPGKYKGYNYIGGEHGLKEGRDVAILQILLNRILKTDLKVDGKYGEETKEAIRRLQKKVNVKVDGYFGIDTKTALSRYIEATQGEGKSIIV